MKTAIYIDGYNLYYGAIRGTPYKWLDVPALFKNIAKRQNQESDCICFKYFSAPAKGKFSKHGSDSTNAQHAYHRALKALYPKELEIILGKHQERKVEKILMSDPIDITNMVEVLNIEEKQTDVNIALEMYRDACRQNFTQQILVTGDSDLQPALKKIKQDYPDIILGVILPVRGVRSGMAAGLLSLADWNENHLRKDELAEHQLPKKIEIGKHINKPQRW